jgi:hypothetical protein
MARTFTLLQARELLAEFRTRLDLVVAARADLAELRSNLARTAPARLGLPEAKALEARIYADLEYLTRRGVLVKGFAPILLDFPGVRDRRKVQWCWLEGEADIGWYHRPDLGFAGRRQL